jgi:tRNA (guanine10-N2)-dimethyltransferase
VRILVELSGEHATLPRAEALAVLEAEGVEIRAVAWTSKILRIDGTGPVERAIRRVGLAHVVNEELVRGDLGDVQAYARSADLAGKSFRIRARGAGDDAERRSIETDIGATLARTGRVNLTSPNLDFRLVVDEDITLGRVIHRVDRSGLESAKVARRPFSLPISLHPKLARALVNLSRVPTAGWVLDPFCGTGGVLLEAARIGLRAIGADVRTSMVAGARRSLRAQKLDADLVRADAGGHPWRSDRFHGIATDPPYGRATSTRGEPLPRLYERAFRAFAEILPRGRYAAAVLPEPKYVELAEAHLDLVEAHALRVHRSLTRTFCAFRRP